MNKLAILFSAAVFVTACGSSSSDDEKLELTSATAISTSEISIEWNGEDAETFNVYINEELAEEGLQGKSTTLTELDSFTEYNIAITSVKGDDEVESELSNTLKATTFVSFANDIEDEEDGCGQCHAGDEAGHYAAGDSSPEFPECVTTNGVACADSGSMEFADDDRLREMIRSWVAEGSDYDN